MSSTHFDVFVSAVMDCPDRAGILGEGAVVYPPRPDFGYELTPKNALTFGEKGENGIHYAILRINGVIREDSPVIHVSPMDLDKPHVVLGTSFLSFVAVACDASLNKMDQVFTAAQDLKSTLLHFMKTNFDLRRLYHVDRLPPIQHLLSFIEPK